MTNVAEQPISLNIVLAVPFEEAVARVTEALKTEGFGVLTTIDVQATMMAKLNVEFAPYTILGACNPQLAYTALQGNPSAGLLLPCNVVARQTADGVLIEIANPSALLTVIQDQTMEAVAQAAREKLERVAALLRAK